MTTGRTPATRPGGSARAGGLTVRTRAGKLTMSAPLKGPGRAGQSPPGGRFGLLLLILISTYLLSAFTTGVWVNVAQIVLFLAIAALATRGGRLGHRTARLAILFAICGTALAVTLAITHPADAGAGAANLWAALVLLGAVILIMGRVLAQREVTLQSIFGAVSAYMVIGLMFAAIYNAANKFDGGTFFANGATGNAKTFQYFSFTTLTTLGYGDYTASDSGGQAVAVMEALLGQVFLATLVARLVSAFRAGGGGVYRPPPPPGSPIAAPAGPAVAFVVPPPEAGRRGAGTRYTYFISRPWTASA
jgi:hypothetical protein